jgi:hypothetical protein
LGVDLRGMGSLLRARASPVASPSVSAPVRCFSSWICAAPQSTFFFSHVCLFVFFFLFLFPVFLAFPMYFGVVLVRVLGVSFGFQVSWGVFLGGFGCLIGGIYCILGGLLLFFWACDGDLLFFGLFVAFGSWVLMGVQLYFGFLVGFLGFSSVG